MTQITRVPVGLQEFLGTQAQGKNPSELAQTVVPTVDFEKFLGIQQEKWFVDGMPAFNANAINTIVVPDNEVWLLRSIGAQHGGGTAGDSYIASVSMNQNANSNGPLNSHPLTEPYTYTRVTNLATINEIQYLNDVIAPGGTQIVWETIVAAVPAANFNMTSFVRYLQLKV